MTASNKQSSSVDAPALSSLLAPSALLSEQTAKQIREMLDQRHLSLRFQDPQLENRFIHHRADQYVDLAGLGWPLLVIIYLMLFGMALQFYPQDMFHQNGLYIWSQWLPAFIALLAGSLLPKMRFFRPYFEWVVGASGAVILLLLMMAIVTAQTSSLAIHAMINVDLMIFILSFATRIRAIACAAMLFAAIVMALLACLLLGYTPDWLMGGHFVLMYSLAALFILALIETNERLSFAQSLLMADQAIQLEQMNQQLARVAREDILSGLPNRRAFDEVFLREWERVRRDNQPMVLLYLDLDYFKAYNDNYGRLAGDAVLQSVAVVLRRSLLRPADQPVRFSGESFMILLPNTSLKGGLQVASRVIEAVDRMDIEHRWSQVAAHLTLSVGVAAYRADENDHLALLRRVDDALHQAKREGRHRFCVDAQSC